MAMIAPMLMAAAPTLLKTIGLGALSGGAGFGISSLLKKITVSMTRQTWQLYSDSSAGWCV